MGNVSFDDHEWTGVFEPLRDQQRFTGAKSKTSASSSARVQRIPLLIPSYDLCNDEVWPRGA